MLLIEITLSLIDLVLAVISHFPFLRSFALGSSPMSFFSALYKANGEKSLTGDSPSADSMRRNLWKGVGVSKNDLRGGPLGAREHVDPNWIWLKFLRD